MTLDEDAPVAGPQPDPQLAPTARAAFDTGQLARVTEGARWRPSWQVQLPRIVAIVDIVAVAIAVAAAYLVRFDGPVIGSSADDTAIRYLAISLWLFAGWLVALGIADTREAKLMGAGPAEYVQVGNATIMYFGFVAILAYLFKYDLARGYVAVALPLGLGLLILGRYAVRQYLHAQRQKGRWRSRTLVVGARQGAAHLIGELRKVPLAGFSVVGACVPGGPRVPGEKIDGVPVVGEIQQAAALVEPLRVDTVMVTGSDEVTPRVVKRLAWDLEPWGADLVLAPALTDVAGPRIHTRPVASLPLMHLEAPGYSGAQHTLKRTFDLVGATVLIVLFAIPLALAALAIKLTSPGPVLFKQERVGLGGKPFTVLKFRSMEDGAEKRLEEVLGRGNVGVFYKAKAGDPRITRVGTFLRRFSIDELPQFFNVLAGSMSLVGPRPQVAIEVAQYDDEIGRRLLVKPGLTGLWQVSGRSNLPLEESVRLDLYYVENWTILGDVMILLRTAKAVLGRDGAY